MGTSNREQGQGEPKAHMLMHDGAVVGAPPRSEEELKDFLHMWVPARPGKNVEEGVMWLKEVAGISYAEALAALYAKNPRVYENLAFSTWGNGYGETSGKFKVDLLEALQKAAEK